MSMKTAGRDSALRPHRTFSRSLLTSLFTTALDFGTLTGLVELVGVNYVLATWLGTVLGSLSNFTINRVWAFDARDRPPTGQFARFLAVQAFASVLHTAGVWGFTRFLGLPYQASKVIISVLVFLGWNYPMNRRFVFRRPAETGAPAGENAPGARS
jgi:putative flippase GtrA